MNKFRRLTAFAAAGAAMLLGSSAQAAVVFLDFNLTAVHSISGYGSINPVLGHFELSFDNSADIAMTSAGLLANINIPTPKTIQYAYSASMDVISIGTDPGVASFGQVDLYDFGFFLSTASAIPTSLYLSYTGPEDTSGVRHYSLFSHEITISPASVSPVPEPATWAMMIGGFGLIGGAMRTKGRKGALAALPR